MKRLLWIFMLLPLACSANEGHAFFESKIRPLLLERCLDCHSEESGKRKGGLWLDRRAAWEQGGDSGPAIVPGKPDESLFIRAIRYHDEALQMPSKSKLPADEIALFERWVTMGAPDPRDAVMAGAVRVGEIDVEAARKKWAYRPLQVRGESIDQHLDQALSADQLEAVPAATPRERLRRLHYDLTGLPPTHAEVAAFERDQSPYAWERRVDELLARQGFGERWGRHWLDVARYADSNGGDRNFTFHHAWRYRNYVIDAFNEDRSFYQFVEEQVAGDLLQREGIDEQQRALIATGFLVVGPKMLTERDKEKLRLDVADEQVDTIGRAFLGLTFGCARCHDHKFDPISQKDYYAMAGIMRSSDTIWGTINGCANVMSWLERPLPGTGKEAELAVRSARLETAMKLSVQHGYKPKPIPEALRKQREAGKPFAGLKGIVVDDAKAEVTGKWRASTLTKPFVGKGYLVHSINEDKNPKRIVFRAELPEAGTYEVRLAYAAGPSRHAALPLKVGAASEHEVKLDQRPKPEVVDHFQPVGRFDFGKGEARLEVLPDDGAGYVIVDAAQWIRVDEIEAEQKAIVAAAKAAKAKPPVEDPIEALYYLSQGELKNEVKAIIKSLQKEPLAMALRDRHDAGDIHLRVRGSTHQRGDMVPRGVPALFEDQPFELGQKDSGRLELARWLVDERSALLDRVMANRIWHHLMGQGIVRTVDNFGALGDAPSHPELLDDLAARFRAGGGSVKSLVREIVTSEAYQRSSDATDGLAAADPENRLFGHQNRRRLSAEELRDSLLLVAKQLDRKPQTATARAFGTDIDGDVKSADKRYRAVYLPVARNNSTGELAVFDPANADLVTGARPNTSVPTQALFMMNSGFVQAQSVALAKRLASAEDRVRELYLQVLQRQPTTSEHARASAFLASFEEADRALELFAHALISSTEFQFLD